MFLNLPVSRDAEALVETDEPVLDRFHPPRSRKAPKTSRMAKALARWASPGKMTIL